MTESNTLWNLIVDAANRSKNCPETHVQAEWVDIFHEIFGYSKLFGEIKEQEKIIIGSHERTIPDILITQNGKSLFVVELKCYNMSKQDKYVEQLKSYMKLLDLEIGVLVCNKLYIFCKDTNGEYPYIEIPFEKDNKNGELFVESFSKKNFNTDFIKDFILEDKKKQEETEAVRKALDAICADGESFLKQYLTEKYSEEAVDRVLEEYIVSIQIRSKRVVITTPRPGPTKPEPHPGPKPSRPKMGRYEAKQFLIQHGYSVGTRYTYGSLSEYGIYWYDIDPEMLTYGFDFILDDCKQKKLYLLHIPAKALPEDSVKYKERPVLKVDFKIRHKNNITFIDTNSNIDLSPYFVGEVSYAE